jgi:hypothetical protein
MAKVESKEVGDLGYLYNSIVYAQTDYYNRDILTYLRS